VNVSVVKNSNLGELIERDDANLPEEAVERVKGTGTSATTTQEPKSSMSDLFMSSCRPRLQRV
jgi:hypothetical protein